MWLISASRRPSGPVELGRPDRGVDPRLGPEDLGAVGRGHGAQFVLPGAGPAEDRRGGELGGPSGRLGRVGDLEADRGDGRLPVPGLLLVEHDPGPPACHSRTGLVR